MRYISLYTVSSLCGLSKRTLWRRIAGGNLRTQSPAEPGERTLVAVDDVLRLTHLHLAPDDVELIVAADGGDPEAQCDLALLFLQHDLPAEAVRWLKMAADKAYPEAMHQLGRCFIAGHSVPPDERIGTELIRNAAGFGHATALRMIQYLTDPARPKQTPAALEAALDEIERKVVMQVLHESADSASP